MNLKVDTKVMLYGGKYGDDTYTIKGNLPKNKSLVFLRDGQGRTFVESVETLSTSFSKQAVEKDN